MDENGGSDTNTCIVFLRIASLIFLNVRDSLWVILIERERNTRKCICARARAVSI